MAVEVERYIYVPPSETEQSFVAWLRVRSAGVETKYMRWLVDPDGDEWEGGGSNLCLPCAQIQRFKNRHDKNGYTWISGWDEYVTEDCPQWCVRCGSLLCVSLSRYGVEQEIDGMSQPGPLSPTDAAIYLEFLDGIGDYNRKIHWPLIEPHAIRLMSEAPQRS